MGWYSIVYDYDSDDDDDDAVSAARKLEVAAGISVREAQAKINNADGVEIAIKYIEDTRGCNISLYADRWTRGLASEGYWGF